MHHAEDALVGVVPSRRLWPVHTAAPLPPREITAQIANPLHHCAGCSYDAKGMFTDQLSAGYVVGEYTIEREVGGGAFGKVYAAVQTMIGKRVAIKVLGIEYSSKPEWVSRFMEEARSVNRIGHKGIVDIFSFGELEDGRQYLVMELLEGVTLKQHLSVRGRLSLTEAAPILRRVARALDAAHNAGIAHRDLKPDNLFLTFDDEGVCHPKLLDFGIAKLVGDDPQRGHHTRTGTPMGTPLYMSPEQCRGQHIDQRTDIYALGVMVHLMLTGSLPFDGGSMVDIMMAHMGTPPPPMSGVAPDLPTALDAPVLAMLAKDPAMRPATPSEAIDRLIASARAVGIAIPTSGEAGDNSDERRSPFVSGEQPAVAADPGQATDAWIEQNLGPGDTGPGNTGPGDTGPGNTGPGHPPVADTVPQSPTPLVSMPATQVSPHAATHAGYEAAAGSKTRWIAVAVVALVLLIAGVVAAIELASERPIASEDKAEDDTSTRLDEEERPVKRDGVTFTKKPRGIGTHVITDGSLVLEASMGKQSFRQNFSTLHNYEVLGHNGTSPTEAQVHVRARLSKVSLNGGPEQTEPSLTHAHVYIVTRIGNDLAAARVGGTITDKEREEVTNDVGGFFLPNEVGRALDGQTMKKGGKLPLAEPEVRQLLGGSKTQIAMPRSEGTLTLMKYSDKRADFELSMNVIWINEGVTYDTQVTGTLAVQPETAWPLEMRLEGPITLSGPGGSQSGTLTMQWVTTYEAPPGDL